MTHQKTRSQTWPRSLGPGKFRRQVSLSWTFWFEFAVAFFGGVLMMSAREQDVERWHNEKSKDSADAHPADKHQTDRVTGCGARAGHQRERKVTADGGNGGHQNRP
jgi:hypothetical protein